MNKSLVAVGVIVALGVVWTGGAWYTGKKIETHLEDMVAQANAQLKLTAPESNLEVSYQKLSSRRIQQPVATVGETHCRERKSVD
ncbi:putative GTP-binding protein [Escherichia coli]|nr:putative GTP-binding protein [Escherichia coli]